MSDGGKGCKPRPFSVDQKTFDSNWEAIFGKKNISEGDKTSFDDRIIDHSGEDQ